MIDRRRAAARAGGRNPKLKQPSAKLLRLIAAYLYVPWCKVEDVAVVVGGGGPPHPSAGEKSTTELLFDGGILVEEEEEDGPSSIEAATLAYYGPLHRRRQRRARKACAPPGRPSGGRRMPGLGREVLRWLVTLNLSFPIKNIKRDFSNGFMVAEIFSRYFPLDIHMHSYDYGSRAASKRDNWEQLNKFFRKKGFVVLNHEIDNIIQCRSEEGAGPLLERMYKFLTQKKREPGDCAAEQLFVQQHDSSKLWNLQAPRDIFLEIDEEDQGEVSCSESGTISINNGDNSEENYCSNYRDSTSVEDVYHGGIKLDPQYERDSLLKMDDEECAFDMASSQNAVRIVLAGQERSQQSGGLLLTSRNKGSNAVEKARQREVKKTDRLAKAAARVEEERFAELARRARVDAGLAFRSPNRKRNFKQYTLPDYRQQKQFGYVRLGSLGPGDPTPELVVQRDNLARRKQFGRHARSCNIMCHTNPTLVDYSKSVKVETASSRRKALAFASRIPKPKVKISTKEESQENLLPLQNPHALSDLQILEAKHQSDKQHVESIRRDLEHFLR